MTERRLAEHTGYDAGRSKLWKIAWFVVMNLVFLKWWCPVRLRIALLRLFGARIGKGVIVRYRARVTWPWNLTIGDDSWIGEGVWIYNVTDVTIGHDVCISQEAFLCPGGHDLSSIGFDVVLQPISIGDRVWIGAYSKVLGGVTVGADAVVGAAAIVARDVTPGAVVVAPAAAPPERAPRASAER